MASICIENFWFSLPTIIVTKIGFGDLSGNIELTKCSTQTGRLGTYEKLRGFFFFVGLFFGFTAEGITRDSATEAPSLLRNTDPAAPKVAGSRVLGGVGGETEGNAPESLVSGLRGPDEVTGRPGWRMVGIGADLTTGFCIETAARF
jgi:hypothetical protein